MANSKNNTAGDALVELFSNVATKLGLDPNILVEKAQELTGEEQAAYMKALQDFDMNSTEESAQAVLSFFQQTPAYQKLGGKIRDFVCKHAKGGRLDCGCKENGGVVKGQDGTKFYNENGVELPNGPIYRDGRFGYVVSPTQEGRVAKFLNDLNGKAKYWNIPPLPIHQNISKFRITANADYPAIYVPTNFEPNEQAEATAKIIRWQPQDKPWNGVEKKQSGGDLNDLEKQLLPIRPIPVGKRVGSIRQPDSNVYVGDSAIVNGDSVYVPNEVGHQVFDVIPGAGYTDYGRIYHPSYTDMAINQPTYIVPKVDVPKEKLEKKQDGGEIDYEYVHPDLISRRQALDLSRQTRGYNRSQARFAYANAKNALRNQGLSGRDLRREARKMLVGYNDGSRELVAPTQVYDTSKALANAIKNIYSQDLLNKALLWTAGRGISPQNNAAAIQQNMDANSFNTAFGYARKLGLKNFKWRGNLYGTKLASGPQMPKIDTTIDTSYEVPGIEFDPVSTGSVQVEQVVPKPVAVSTLQTLSAPGDNRIVPEITTSGISRPAGTIAQPTPSFMRVPGAYGNINLTENIPQSWYIGTRPNASQPAAVVETPVEPVVSEEVPANVQSQETLNGFKPSYLRASAAYAPIDWSTIPQDWYIRSRKNGGKIK